MQDQKDYLRLRSLYKERILEIMRQGVIVELYHRHQILPAYLQCTLVDRPKFEAFLDSRLSLQLCDLNGVPLMKIGKNSYFTKKSDFDDECRVFLQKKQNFRGMKQGPHYILVKNNATIGVLSQILSKRLEGDRYFHKIQDFIGDDSVMQIPMEKDIILEYETQSDLNEQQNQAISSVFSNHLTFIKGPPGCGKTKTVCRMVKMLAERSLKVLVGSVSNLANQTLINQIIRQMSEHNYFCDAYPQINMKKVHLLINYSHKALQKVSEQAKFYSINEQLYHYIMAQNTSQHYHQGNIMQEIQKLQQGQKVSNMFWAIYMKSYTKLIADVNVIISTTINSSKLCKYTQFKPDIGIIDQAAQASWTDTYGFLAFGVTRMVFVGDEKQLRPTVIGDSTSNEILKETMFEKISQKNPDYYVHLKRQYRMHPQIAQFPNQQIYNNLLVNDPSTQKRQCSLQYFRIHPISFVTHNFTQQVYESTQSIDSQKGVKEYYNQYQGSLIMDFLFSIPLHQWKNIGILTFYDMQCQVIAKSLESTVENFYQYGLTIKTIDGYQGGQKDYILISTVRSNSDKNPGFCTQLNRVNVSLTRAKKGLIVLGDPQTLTQGKFPQEPGRNLWGKFYEFMNTKQKVFSYQAWHQLIEKIKQKQITSTKFYTIYIYSLQLMQLWNSFPSHNDDQIMILNPQVKSCAIELMKKVLCLRQEYQGEISSKLKFEVLSFLKESIRKQHKKFGQNQIQYSQNEESLVIQQQDFKHKVYKILKNSLTHKQISLAFEFIQQLSKLIYKIISTNHQLMDFQKLNEQLKRKLKQEEHKIILQTESTINEWMQANKQGLILSDKEREVQKLLVSWKLMYDLIQLYKAQIDPQVVQLQTTKSNQI